MAICYYCGISVTRKDGGEHVPPRCLFPEVQNTIGRSFDFRSGPVIKVPSCAEHNSRLSQSDEIFLYLSLTSPNINRHGRHYLSTDKGAHVARSLRARSVLSEHARRIDGRDFLVSEVNALAQMTVLEKIGRGLYFHDCQCSQIFSGTVLPIPLHQFGPELDRTPGTRQLLLLGLPSHALQPQQGTHPDIFAYTRCDRLGPKQNLKYTEYLLTIYGEPSWLLVMKHHLPGGT